MPSPRRCPLPVPRRRWGGGGADRPGSGAVHVPAGLGLRAPPGGVQRCAVPLGFGMGGGQLLRLDLLPDFLLRLALRMNDCVLPPVGEK